MSKIINSCGNFQIRVEECCNAIWLYWLDKPLKHLTKQEYADLELLMKTTEI